jgi:hypothetical protein
LFRFFQGLSGELAIACAAGFLLRNQSGMFEHANVFHYRGQRHAIRLSQLGDGSFAKHQRIENGAAGRIGQGAKGRIQLRGTLNHMV